MLRDVEIGVKFYKELGKLEKQLAKYQSKVLEIKKDIEKDKENLARVEADESEKGYEKKIQSKRYANVNG
ncbi:hypothetical protein HpNP141_13480 [Helicobacter pylori]|nr:hypothetical protein KVK10_07250 [Helicobacter pylori]WRA60727.1 hypothetical protein KVL21_07055 [Helicobacter pylori]